MRMRKQLKVVFIVLAASTACFLAAYGQRPASQTKTRAGPAGIYDVRAFGATGDGKALDTIAINKAIEAAVQAGGGTVRFPAGNYLSVSIHLKSNIALYLDQGATIVAV